MKKIKVALVLFTSMIFSLTGFAQNLKTETSVDFKIRNLGINVDGYFRTTSITANFTNKDSSQWILSGSVKVNSINTDNEKRDAHLLGEDFFDADNYTQITLQSKNFKKISEHNYEVTVDLTIKKTTKTIQIPVEIIGDANSFKLRSNFEINRRDYDVGGGSLILSNTAKISVYYALNN